MKFILPSILTTATVALAAVLFPALPLDLVSHATLSSPSSVSTLMSSLLETPRSNLSLPFPTLPDTRFKVKMNFGTPLLPINSALINILNFMSIVAQKDFMRRLPPRSIRSPDYPDVQITSYAWTEAYFLLWGIYYAANDMVKFARFNDVMLDLYLEEKLVGRIQIARKPAPSLAGGAGNLTQDLGDLLAPTNLTASSEDTAQPKPGVRIVAANDLAPLISSNFNASSIVSLSAEFEVHFINVEGAGHVDRNDVFMTFYNAIMHIAQFPIEMQMQSFDSDSPSGKLHLHMQEVGINCQVS